MSSLAHAHHSVANFDLNAEIELKGVVADLEFLNPHSWLHIDVEGADGRLTRWRCELRGATVLRRSGWSEAMFTVGTPVTVLGSPARRDPETCYLGSVEFSDGTRVERYAQLGQPLPRATSQRALRLANGDPNIAGDWAAEQLIMTDRQGFSGALVPLSVVEQFQEGDLPSGLGPLPGTRGTAVSFAANPIAAFHAQVALGLHRGSLVRLTEEGLRASEAIDPDRPEHNPALRCEPTSIWYDWMFETEVNRISQTEREIRLFYGARGLERTVHLDRTVHPQNIPPSRAGHSIGRWENDQLIVETVGFEPGFLSVIWRIPHTDQLRVTERFTLDPQTFALTREFTADDPRYFEAPFRWSDTVLPSDLPYEGESECRDPLYYRGRPAGD